MYAVKTTSSVQGHLRMPTDREPISSRINLYFRDIIQLLNKAWEKLDLAQYKKPRNRFTYLYMVMIYYQP